MREEFSTPLLFTACESAQARGGFVEDQETTGQGRPSKRYQETSETDMPQGKKTFLTLPWLTLLIALLLAAVALPGTGRAQAVKPAAPAAAPAGPGGAAGAPANAQAVQAIPVPAIAAQAEVALASISQLQEPEHAEDLITSANEQLPLLAREASHQLREARLLQREVVSLEVIAGLEEEVRGLEQKVSPIRRDLTRAAQALDRDLKQLQAQGAVWAATVDGASHEAAPAQILQRAREVNTAIARTQRKLQADQAAVLTVQGHYTDVGTRIADARQLLTLANQRAVTRLIYQDSPPMWQGDFWGTVLAAEPDQARDNLLEQASAMTDYARAHVRDFAFHLLFFACLAILLASARSRVESWSADDEGLRASKDVFDMPVASALLFAMLFSTWFYPRPPRALWLAFGVLAAAPLLLFIRRAVDRRLYPALHWTVVFYLLDRVRAMLAPYPGLHRLFLLAEALGLIAVLLHWLREPQAAASATQAPLTLFSARALRAGSIAALVLALAALASNVAGALRLTDLLLRTLLGSAYTAAVFYALILIGQGLVHALLHLPPANLLAGVRHQRTLIAARITTWLKWAAFLAWAALTLQIPGFLQQAIGLLRSFWGFSFQLGSLKVSISALALFFLILWATWLVSRLSRFLLEEEIFSRVHLDRGLPYAVSTTVHYIILLTGLVLALTAMGVDMTKFTVVAGALTVGIGFGLQNIVNNFVSGLIVLFERPVKVGDTIQIDDVVGRVQHIGIRATVIQSTSGAEVIVPNGKLISDKVTNWTLANQLRQIAVPVVTKPDVDVPQLKTMLQEIARANRQVVQSPAPEVLFTKRGVDTFEFELRVWTADLDAWLQVKSDLITDINEALSHRALAARVRPADAD